MNCSHPLLKLPLVAHPHRVLSVTYRKLRPFHGGNRGSRTVARTPNQVLGVVSWRTSKLF